MINIETMLFEELTLGEATDLYFLARAIILHGNSAHGHPLFEAWCEALEYEDRQRLLVMSTVFPQRALLSVIRYVGFPMGGETNSPNP
jgi:hypothetical protein